MIPLSVPNINGNEWKYIKECLDTNWVSSAGKFVDLFENKIAEYSGAEFAIACVNGTSAIQISLKLAGVGPGDEVIAPTITFIAPVNAIRYNGANPIFMDVDNYYNIDSRKTIEFIKKETFFKEGFSYNKRNKNKISAILPVHMWGNALWLDDLVDICEERNIAIVEDASESLGSVYTEGKFSGKHTGTIGMLGCLSFNGNKIITTGGGGMILTNDVELADKARYLITQAKDDPIRYIHNEIGYNFRLTNVQAALGLAQLEQISNFLINKRATYNKYVKLIDEIDGLKMAETPKYSSNNHWMNILSIDVKEYGISREKIMSELDKEGIETRPIWFPNHLQKPYIDCQTYEIRYAEKLVEDSLCLPSSSSLLSNDIELILSKIKNIN
tara:strand:- start:11144 stop:12301 length:1158 start_codon:yes stop_codon:yes gene_type:complete